MAKTLGGNNQRRMQFHVLAWPLLALHLASVQFRQFRLSIFPVIACALLRKAQRAEEHQKPEKRHSTTPHQMT